MMVNAERFRNMASECCLEAEVPSWVHDNAYFDVTCHYACCDLHATFYVWKANNRVRIITEPTCNEEE